MPRNACINHPRKDVIEVPAGSKFCTRCRTIIPPEAESAPSFETVKELTGASATPEVIGVLPEEATETPAEPELTEEIKAVEESVVDELAGILEDVMGEEKAPDKPELEAELDPAIDHDAILYSAEAHGVEDKAAKSEVIVRETESQEETALAEADEPIAEEVAAPSPEEEAEVAKNAIDETVVIYDAQKAEIARLKAKLAELEPKE